MTKWEYTELEVTIGGPLTGTQAEATTFRSNGKHDSKKGNKETMFAQLGEAGWELVCSSARTDTGLGGKHKINYLFKRPVAVTP